MRTRARRFGASLAPAIEELRAPAAVDACGPRRKTLQLCVRRFGKPGPELSTPRAVCDFARKYIGGADRETFLAVHVDARHRVIAVEEVARGHLTGVEVHPREVFKGALLSNAARVIVAHNHPSSGDPEPSPQDLALTERLRQAGGVIGIPVDDHVIVGRDRCVSLHERGEFGRAK